MVASYGNVHTHMYMTRLTGLCVNNQRQPQEGLAYVVKVYNHRLKEVSEKVLKRLSQNLDLNPEERAEIYCLC